MEELTMYKDQFHPGLELTKRLSPKMKLINRNCPAKILIPSINKDQ